MSERTAVRCKICERELHSAPTDIPWFDCGVCWKCVLGLAYIAVKIERHSEKNGLPNLLDIKTEFVRLKEIFKEIGYAEEKAKGER